MANTFLTGETIKSKCFNNSANIRGISVDMHIDCVIKKGKAKKVVTTVNLKPQEILTVVLEGRIKIPPNCFGIAYPKTSLSQKGIHTLSTGIVDPGFDGYLSTIIINYSTNEIELRKDDVCLRLMIYESETSFLDDSSDEIQVLYEDYIEKRIDESESYPDTFLDIQRQIRTITDNAANIATEKATTKMAIIFGGLSLFLTIIIGLFTFFLTTSLQTQNNMGGANYVNEESYNKEYSELQEELQRLQEQIRNLDGQSGAQEEANP